MGREFPRPFFLKRGKMLEQPNIIKNGNNYVASFGEDKDLFVEFSHEAIHMEAESLSQGYPVYKDIPHITIIAAGNNKSKVMRPIRTTMQESAPHAPDPERFPHAWARFMAGQEQVQDGLPVEKWAPIGKAQSMSLKASNIHTVEQLASLPDSALDVLGFGGRGLRDLAQSYLAQAKDGSELQRLNKENENLKSDIEILKMQFAELAKDRNTSKNKG